MTDISGDKNPEIYRQECSRGVELFQKSLTAYQSAEGSLQRDAFKDVMDKALKVIQETVPQCLNEHLKKQEKRLEADYQNYLAAQTPENLNRVSKDLSSLKQELY